MTKASMVTIYLLILIPLLTKLLNQGLVFDEIDFSHSLACFAFGCVINLFLVD